MMSQTTLGEFGSTSTPVDVQSEQNTLVFSEEHIDDLYQTSEEGIFEKRVEDYFLQEKAENEDIQRMYRDFEQYDTQNKPQYIRVGRRK